MVGGGTSRSGRGNWDQGGSVVGRSIKTDRYRYTAWIERASDAVVARQLYDHQVDPLEAKNLAADLSYGGLVERLHNQLSIGWRGALGPAGEFVLQEPLETEN